MMKYPSPGIWINSCLIGMNAYQILSGESEIQAAFLEEDSTGVRRNGAEHHYASVITSGDHRRAWMVFFSMTSSDMEELTLVLESIQRKQLYQKGFFWPFDLTWDLETKGYLIHPIDTIHFRPIRTFLANPQAPRWLLAKSLFQRISVLHHAELTLNGFSREQLRVDSFSNEVFIWPSETISQFGGSQHVVCQNSYLSIPQKIEQQYIACGKKIEGWKRDLFSAAVMAFHLLFYTHPFVGSSYWELMRDDYRVQYQNLPEYIFDPNGSNHLGHQEFEQEILAQWKRTIPELQTMFHNLFLDVCHPNESTRIGDHWNADAWIDILRVDAEKNDNAVSRTSYPFETVCNYQV